MTSVSVLARPKINLFLHVTGRRLDGYHTLESLAVFAETGDRVTASADEKLSLSVNGPFADSLSGESDNLVLRAARALQKWALQRGLPAPGAALQLEKRLPIASGIGGGSADAAATLVALSQLWRLQIDDADLAALALTLGADVPVCLESRSRMMRGVGEKLSEAPELPPCWLVLVNPQRLVSTPAVFAGLEGTDPAKITMPHSFETPAALAAWLSESRNDLERPAMKLVPEIGVVLDALSAGTLIARMSGSGATCFGLFESQQAALAASRRLSGDHPDWWIEAAAVSR